MSRRFFGRAYSVFAFAARVLVVPEARAPASRCSSSATRASSASGSTNSRSSDELLADLRDALGKGLGDGVGHGHEPTIGRAVNPLLLPPRLLLRALDDLHTLALAAARPRARRGAARTSAPTRSSRWASAIDERADAILAMGERDRRRWARGWRRRSASGSTRVDGVDARRGDPRAGRADRGGRAGGRRQRRPARRGAAGAAAGDRDGRAAGGRRRAPRPRRRPPARRRARPRRSSRPRRAARR